MPNNPHTAQAMARENQKSTPVLPGADWREPTHFIIGHGGTPIDGCTTIHLCAPAKGWDESFGWELAVKIFDATEEAGAAPPVEDLAPSEEVPEFEVEPIEEGEEEGGVRPMVGLGARRKQRSCEQPGRYSMGDGCRSRG